MSEERVAITVDEYWPADIEAAEEGIVVNWFVREDANVIEDDTLCEIQVEKVSVDVTAPDDGTVDEIAIEEGGEFSRGDTLAWIQPD